MRRQSGISMVEILVALTLSLILTLVIGQIYVSNSQAYRLQEAQSRIQENGRFALEFLSKDVRRAGNMGCLSVLNTPLVIANSSPSITPATSILGYDAVQTSSYPVSGSTSGTWNPTAPSVSALAGTDILSIQFAEPCGGHLQTPITGMTPSPSSNLSSTNTCSITAGTKELVLSDCSQSEIFRSDSDSSISVQGTSNNTQDHFTYSHGLDAEVMVVRAYTYFIQPFPGNAEPTLYLVDNATLSNNGKQPLIEGVEDMQLLYGVDLNADWSVDQYVTADNVSNWAKVIAIRVDLVIRSTGVAGTNLTTATTACNGVAVTDTRLRRCFSFTINLRNPKA